MNSDLMKQRTKNFALSIIELISELPKTGTAYVIGKQLLRSSTSVGANYRSACRGRSKAEFIAKLGIVEEEADESMYWLELLRDARIVPGEKTKPPIDEINEIIAIIVATIRNAKAAMAKIAK